MIDVSMQTKEKLLSSISPDMKLTADFFKKVYGYELSFPGFADEALEKLEAVGCSKAWQYYEDWTAGCEKQQKAVLKSVAEWYRQRCEQEWKNNIKAGE